MGLSLPWSVGPRHALPGFHPARQRERVPGAHGAVQDLDTYGELSQVARSVPKRVKGITIRAGAAREARQRVVAHAES
jgi:hypothetical protein